MGSVVILLIIYFTASVSLLISFLVMIPFHTHKVSQLFSLLILVEQLISKTSHLCFNVFVTELCLQYTCKFSISPACTAGGASLRGLHFTFGL